MLANSHFTFPEIPEDHTTRKQNISQLLEFMQKNSKNVNSQLIIGDFNCDHSQPLAKACIDLGFNIFACIYFIFCFFFCVQTSLHSKQTNIHTYIHTYLQTHTHTHTHTLTYKTGFVSSFHDVNNITEPQRNKIPITHTNDRYGDVACDFIFYKNINNRGFCCFYFFKTDKQKKNRN